MAVDRDPAPHPADLVEGPGPMTTGFEWAIAIEVGVLAGVELLRFLLGHGR
jgi:hypothetical protein